MFHGGFDEWVFVTALGELRGVAEVIVAELATKYDLDVEDGLASILPAEPDVDESERDRLTRSPIGASTYWVLAIS